MCCITDLASRHSSLPLLQRRLFSATIVQSIEIGKIRKKDVC